MASLSGLKVYIFVLLVANIHIFLFISTSLVITLTWLLIACVLVYQDFGDSRSYNSLPYLLVLTAFMIDVGILTSCCLSCLLHFAKGSVCISVMTREIF